MRNSTKCVNYILYNTLFAHEPYLVSVKSYKHKRALSFLKLSAHKLEIEVGRYNPVIPRHMRSCRVCDDEYNFIPGCPKYRALLMKLIPTHYWQRPNMIKFIELMTRDDLNIITYHHGYTKKNNGIYHAIKSHECPGQR